MIVYRLSKAKYSHDLSGKGAEKTGGRWNSKRVSMVYTSESRALCTAEIAVHTPLGIIPKDYSLTSIYIPNTIRIKTISINDLPLDWKSIPHSGNTQDLGDQFIRENKYAVLKVPSAVVLGDHNYLINPNHKDSEKIIIKSVEPFAFDKRLFLK